MRRHVSLLVVVLLSLLVLASSAGAAVPGEVTRFDLPPSSAPEGIAAGPDGNLWFAEPGSDHDRPHHARPGQVTEFPLPTPEARAVPGRPRAPTATYRSPSRGRATSAASRSGEVRTEFAVCHPYCRPWGITAGPEGDVWFTLPVAGEVGRITPTAGRSPASRSPWGPTKPTMIAAGADGNLWIADRGLVDEEPTIQGRSSGWRRPVRRRKVPRPDPDRKLPPDRDRRRARRRPWFAGSGTGPAGASTQTGSITEFTQDPCPAKADFGRRRPRRQHLIRRTPVPRRPTGRSVGSPPMGI